jgi:hypothetical protein
LINLDRLNRVFSDNVQDITHILLQKLGVLFLKRDQLIQNNQLDIIIVLILQKLQVGLNSNLDGRWSSRQLNDSIGTLQENTGAL